MTDDGQQDNQPSQEERAAQIAPVKAIIQGFGAILMLAAPLIGLNAGGIADRLGFDDDLVRKALGGALFFMGLVDFFVVPKIFENAALRDRGRGRQ